MANTDRELIEILKTNQEIIEDIFEHEDENGIRMVFVPNEVNGQSVNHSGRTIQSLGFVTEAIIQYLNLNPGTREFKLTGNVEW